MYFRVTSKKNGGLEIKKRNYAEVIINVTKSRKIVLYFFINHYDVIPYKVTLFSNIKESICTQNYTWLYCLYLHG